MLIWVYRCVAEGKSNQTKWNQIRTDNDKVPPDSYQTWMRFAINYEVLNGLRNGKVFK